MDRNRRIAVIVGILFIIGTVSGALSVVSTGPVLDNPDYISNAPAGGSRIIMGSIFVLIMGLALALIPVVMFPVARKHNEALAVGYVVFRGALETFTYILLVISWLCIFPVREIFIHTGDATGVSPGMFDPSTFITLSRAVLEGEVISTMTTVVFILGALMFYILLYQSKLIPRWISGWGIISALPYLTAGFLVMFSTIEHMSVIDTVLRIPLAVQEMVLAVWLIVKGFNSAESGT